MNGSGRTHAGKLDHMIEVTARAGFTGIEPIHGWMGELADPVKLRDCLQKNGVELAAIALALPWNGSEETAHERAEADRAIALLKEFPGALLCTVQLPSGRHDLETRRLNLVANVNTVSRRAVDAGVPCSYHPNSPHASTNRTAEDYAVILEKLDSRVTGWTPDVGHMANGGMDPLEMMKRYASLINLVHFKDWNGAPEFSLMGQGKVDFVSITRWLVDQRYSGWIICEDEGPQALDDPDGVTLHDGRWIAETLLPQL
ncbi:MAG TPA: sugar phosphate isomerase/epimerase family protein [Opitutus sp.]|nr:sugar phosphate isomerase/epimerase family protein [Opitutus sp.]